MGSYIVLYQVTRIAEGKVHPVSPFDAVTVLSDAGDAARTRSRSLALVKIYINVVPYS